MSSQGTGRPSQHHGMKNTTDPRAKDPAPESAGPVTSDSLAAESYNAGGEFARNKNAAPGGVSGDSSTYNTTDTSAATKLDAVEEATKRDDGYDESQRGPGGVKYAEGLGGQPNVSGSTTSQGYSGGPTKKKDHDGGEDSVSKSDHKSSASGSENQSKNDSTSPASETKKQSKDDNKSEGNTASSAGVAPTYINDVYLGELGKPKGKNLIEDENLEGDRKTDFEIGSKDDPGRAAVEGFENSNTSELQSGVDKENPYSELQGDDDRA